MENLQRTYLIIREHGLTGQRGPRRAGGRPPSLVPWSGRPSRSAAGTFLGHPTDYPRGTSSHPRSSHLPASADKSVSDQWKQYLWGSPGDGAIGSACGEESKVGRSGWRKKGGMGTGYRKRNGVMGTCRFVFGSAVRFA
jgi:hypothetical protein